ncbi:hypothetical protein HCR08_01115 [Wolbachia pipientis]|nr:hypothetical protein [Wolbachia pipientis]
MLLACYSHKHISYRIRTIIRKAITAIKYRNYVGFSASGYYKWTTRKISSRESANKELLEAIQKIYQVKTVLLINQIKYGITYIKTKERWLYLAAIILTYGS